MSEKNLIIQEIVSLNSVDDPLLVEAPLILFLSAHPDLLGFYITLLFFSRKPFSKFMSQSKLSELMDIDYHTYIKKRNKLRDMGLLEFKTLNNNQVKIILLGVKVNPDYYQSIEILNKGGMENFHSSGMEKFHTPSNKEYGELLDFSRKMISSKTKKNYGPIFDEDNIYIKYINILNKYNINNNKLNNINIKLNTIAKEKNLTPVKLVPKKEKKTYPIADYDKVLKAYMRYKGIMLKGPELAGARKVIKLMFEADRTVEQIIGFMRWIYQSEDQEEFGWLKSWTIWTVQKKISEYIAGKFGKKLVDENEIYRPS